MGATVTAGINRTLMATVLIVALVAVPYGAWFLAGMSSIAQEGAANLQDVSYKAGIETRRLAWPLSGQIDRLVLLESARPFFHYQNRYHDVRIAEDETSIVRSPLAGNIDPLVQVYFQVDASGKVTLPTLNEDIPDLNAGVSQEQHRFREMLQAMSEKILAANQSQQTYDRPGQGVRLKWDREVWRKTNEANRLYQEQRSGRQGEDNATDKADDKTGAGSVTITIGPLHWHTLVFDARPTPFALRPVQTPAGLRVQGFVLSMTHIQRWLDRLGNEAFDVKFVAGRPTRYKEIAAPVYDLSWRLKADVAKPIEAVDKEMRSNRRTFFLQFGISALAAAIAGGCIIVLVSRSERLARERSRFAALAAHELRTPLAGLQMYGEMLAEGLGEPGRAKVYARRISDEAQRLGRVVSNVLGFSRLERGSLVVRLHPGNLGETISDCVTRQAFELEKAGVTLDMDIDSELPDVKFDRDAVGQMAQNLLDNAEKYSREAEDRTVHIRVAQEAHGVVFSVRDHGPGIDPALQRDLFRPFARGQGADAPAGIGLGLTVTQALVKAHGGSISGTNAADGGAVFAVTFPA